MLGVCAVRTEYRTRGARYLTHDAERQGRLPKSARTRKAGAADGVRSCEQPLLRAARSPNQCATNCGGKTTYRDGLPTGPQGKKPARGQRCCRSPNGPPNLDAATGNVPVGTTENSRAFFPRGGSQVGHKWLAREDPPQMPALTSRPLAVRPAKQAVAPASRHPSRSSTYRDPFLRGVRTSHPIAYPLRAPFHKRFSETATGTLLSVRSPSKTLPYWQEHVGATVAIIRR
jgi:hypothetical protein